MAEGMLEPANGRVTLSAVVVGVLRPKGRFRIGSLLQIRSYRFWWAWVLFRSSKRGNLSQFLRRSGREMLRLEG